MKLTDKKSLTDKEKELVRDPDRWLPSQGEKITHNEETVGTLSRGGRLVILREQVDGSWRWSGFRLPKPVVKTMIRKAKWIDVIYQKRVDERILFRSTPGSILEEGDELKQGTVQVSQADFMYAYSDKKDQFLNETQLKSKGQQGLGDFQ